MTTTTNATASLGMSNIGNDDDSSAEYIMMEIPATSEYDEDDEDMNMMKAFLEESAIIDDITEHALNVGGVVGLPTSNTRQVSDSTHGTAANSSTPTPVVVLPVVAAKPGGPNAHSHAVTQTELPLVITGRPPIRLYLSCNPDYLSPYQCLIRKHIELFEATDREIHSRIKGRNKPIVLGQVGIRCCFCSHIPPSERAKGGMYFPSNLVGIYQAAQILSQQHLMESCQFIHPELRQQFMALRNEKSLATSGKEYWAKTAQVLGVYEDQFGLRFEERLGYVPRH
jgi:hypothetical protein